MKELVKAENISVIRNGKAILDNVSLNLGSGDFITIVGPNGAGKTTLLKSLMGIIAPDNGTIRRKSGLKTGYVPQRLQPDQSIPVTAKRFLTLRNKISSAKLDQIAEETGTGDLFEKALHELSGGELQRVLLARALLREPDILILDEPAQNLDISGQLKLYSLVDNAYKHRNLCVVMVSHDIHLVMSSTRQVICLYHHISCSGKPSAIARDPAFKSIFGEDMARMMSIYTHNPEENHHCGEHDHTCHFNGPAANKEGNGE